MSTFDPKQFRAALGSFLSGVTVVTARGEAGLRGMTASAFTSVSMDPPLVLVCVGRKAHLHGILREGLPFGISILAEDQGPLSNHFAGFAPDVQVPWEESWGRTPVIGGALAWLDCEVHAMLDGGDHSLVLGRVAALHTGEGLPLAYWRGRYGKFTPGG